MVKGRDYIGVGTGALIFNSGGEVLLGQRGPLATNESGKWEFPGGGVEFGEKCADAIVREIREEFDIEISIVQMLEVVDHILPAEGQHWVSITYIAHLVSGKPRIMEPGKCSAIRWVKMEEVRESELSFVSAANWRRFRAENTQL